MDYEQLSRGRTVRDMPAQMRPRELVSEKGIRWVQDDVLIAILLRSGVRGMNVVELARELLHRFGSLAALASATAEEIASVHGMGAVKAQVLMSALELGKRMNDELRPVRPGIKRPADVADLLADKVRLLDKEIFWVLMLNARNALKCEPVEVSVGLLDASLVHAREVFRDAIRNACGAVILAHNHPSGDTAPSAEDLAITRKLVEAGKVIDIKVLDHVVLGRGQDGGFLSMREEGLVNFS